MTVLRILKYPDPRLRLKAIVVEEVGVPKIQKIIDDMLETLEVTDSCAGLSSTQLDIDVDRVPRITVIDQSYEQRPALVLVNPEIVHREGGTSYTEGCMSIYPEEIHADVERAEKITVKALDRDGNVIEFATDGFLAICIQHEIDHLNGVLYLDHLSLLKRNRINKKIAKLKQRY